MWSSFSWAWDPHTFQGENNDTGTVVDTVVFDIRSRKMLFPAPAANKVKGAGTPVNLNLALDRGAGYFHKSPLVWELIPTKW